MDKDFSLDRKPSMLGAVTLSMALNIHSVMWTDAFHKGFSGLLFSSQKIIAITGNGAIDLGWHYPPGLSSQDHLGLSHAGPCLTLLSIAGLPAKETLKCPNEPLRILVQ